MGIGIGGKLMGFRVQRFLKFNFTRASLALPHTWHLMFTLFKPHFYHARRKAFSTLFQFAECMIVPV
jgi:hypothetical protein